MRIVQSTKGPLLDSWVDVYDDSPMLAEDVKVYTGHFIDWASELDWWTSHHPGDLSFEVAE